MRAGGRRVGSALAIVVLLGVTAACGEKPEDAPDAAPSSSEPTKKPGKKGQQLPTDGDATDPGADASDLADIAEDLANENRGTIEPRNEPVQGADISWPQCPKGMGIPEKQGKGLPMPVDEAEFVVFGLTNGPGFTPNPCLADQVAWAEERELMTSAYAVASYPDDETLKQYEWDGPYSGDRSRAGSGTPATSRPATTSARWSTPGCSRRSCGSTWSRCRSSSGAPTAPPTPPSSRGRHGPTPTPATRSASTRRRTSGRRSSATTRSAGCRSGGPRGRPHARKRSTAAGEDWSIQGGTAILGQWVADNRDHNVTCPGVALDLGLWFHQS